jgi:hypothetical protein
MTFSLTDSPGTDGESQPTQADDASGHGCCNVSARLRFERQREMLPEVACRRRDSEQWTDGWA